MIVRVGTGGTTASSTGGRTVIVTDFCTDPSAPAQVSVYVLFVVIFPIDSDPESVFVPDQLLEATQDVAFVELQVSVGVGATPVPNN